MLWWAQLWVLAPGQGWVEGGFAREFTWQPPENLLRGLLLRHH